MVVSFPQELVRLIIEEVDGDTATLYSLALTCKHLHSEAIRALYRSMTLSDGTLQYKFLLRIRKDPQLCKLVQIYHSPRTTNKQRGSLWGLIRTCLPLMVNLKELSLVHVPGDPMKILPSTPKGQPAPFQLKKLRVAVLEHQNKVVQLLESQPELEHLHVLDLDSFAVISPQACPKLRILYTNVYFARLILPGRHVIELGLQFGGGFWNDVPFNFNIDDALSQDDTAHVRRLAIDRNLYRWIPDTDSERNDSERDDSNDERGGKPFQNVEVLQVTQKYIGGVAQFRHATTTFPQLRHIIFAPSTPILPEREEELYEDVPLLFTNPSKLQHVDVLWSAPNLYRRWGSDGVPEADLISLPPIFHDRLA
ncbi:hypothetical protein CVT26_003990 [Gymnopilus dilepis]|uniref:F-box domain-containing protein n=1 Tax=Gymnopilus dilepis TaxID=231916 RepID=A0A409YV22_9AGAR|nr:hypothetical protein CVT26_003990 [Gymnopilus dilepis]